MVASNGWHSSIIVRRSDLPPGLMPEAEDFPDTLYLGFGWGDAEYFPQPDPGLGTALRAALQPTPAVLHLMGLRSDPRAVFSAQEVIELRLAPPDFERLAAYLDQTFQRHGKARASAVAPGLYNFSQFYPASGRFHLFNTCNTWTARGLRLAGVPLETSGVQRAEDLMRQLRALMEKSVVGPDGELRAIDR